MHGREWSLLPVCRLSQQFHYNLLDDEHNFCRRGKPDGVVANPHLGHGSARHLSGKFVLTSEQPIEQRFQTRMDTAYPRDHLTRPSEVRLLSR